MYLYPGTDMISASQPKPGTATTMTRCLANNYTFSRFSLHVTEQRRVENQRFAYRQVGTVAVTVVDGSYNPGPPEPASDVADFRRLVSADTEEPLTDQLRPSLDCHGPSWSNSVPPPHPHPPRKTSQQRRPYRPVIYDLKVAIKIQRCQKNNRKKEKFFVINV